MAFQFDEEIAYLKKKDSTGQDTGEKVNGIRAMTVSVYNASHMYSSV